MEDTVDASGEGRNNDHTDARGQTSQQPRVPDSEFVADHYNMKHKNRGVAIIINNMTFNPRTRMGPRTGSDRDADSMYKLLDMLHFSTIIRRDDQSVADIKKLLSDVSKMDHSDNDCFLCVFLSHGEEGYVYGTDNRVPMDELTSFFKGSACQGLVGKPKIFIIQACRGSELDHGATVADGAEADEADIIRRIPTEADFLMAYSVLPGYYAWRNTQNGSWFIQAIFEVFRQNYQKMDILTMLTRVNKRVAYDFESNTNNINMSGKKQIPCITSMLTKDLFFVEPVTTKP